MRLFQCRRKRPPTGVMWSICLLSSIAGTLTEPSVSYFDEVIDEYKKFEQLISSRQTMVLRLPNGVYRNVLLLSRPGDPMGFRIEWHLEVWSRMNDGSFWIVDCYANWWKINGQFKLIAKYHKVKWAYFAMLFRIDILIKVIKVEKSLLFF